MLQPPPDNITWVHAETQAWFDSYHDKIKFVKGIPKSDSFNPHKKNLFVINDLFQEINKEIVQLFTAGSHH